ncbi:nucleoside hydrolase [Paenibacillus alkalitolerans]|uniref:nucleoside hydrolase n=1 Tax=Paenibacillus alkalitolerans TaxID=2799335 RepID=UPI0018F52560|nr:nucleoside hydrolase [Paenibacillus alkalitolerans]
MPTTKMILDVDTGIDDALAILLALKSEHIRLEGLTTVYGNVGVEQATKNTLAVLELSGVKYEVPVAMGASGPLFCKWRGAVPWIHGNNGLGEYELPEPKQKPLDEFAPDFIVRKINEQPGELTLVFVGRMTNLAVALAKDPSIASKVKRLVLMGGALNGIDKANIGDDPEAAHRVFESGMPITMVGWDVTMKTLLLNEEVETFKELAASAGPGKEKLIEFVDSILKFYSDAYVKHNGLKDKVPLYDPLAVAVAEDPTLVVTEGHYITIETKGELSRGATLADLRHPPSVTNASVCVGVDRDRFIDRFLEVLAR